MKGVNTMNKCSQDVKAGNKNNCGFTLVELIVVMCLMGIIMGAVLNLMRPTSRLYAQTNRYLVEEESVSTISEYLQSELMYATGVYVYCGDESESDINAIAVDNGITMKNCIVLDNVTARTDTQKAVNAGATGVIKKYAYSSSHYVDVTSNASLTSGNKLYQNGFMLQDQSFMDDDYYRFRISNATINSGVGATPVHALTVDIDVFRPEYNSSTGNYQAGEQTFTASKSIEFVNLSAGVATETSIFNISYSDPKYIYIFYTRSDRVSETSVSSKYECFVKNTDGDYISVFSGTAPEGSDITTTVMENAEINNLETFIIGSYVYTRTGLYSTVQDDIWVDGKIYYDLANLTNSYGGTVKLYAVYKKELVSSMPKPTVTFKRADGSTAITCNINYGGSVTEGDKTQAEAILDSYRGFSSDGSYYTDAYWAIDGTSVQQTSFDNITTDLTVSVHTYTKWRVQFNDCSGNLAYLYYVEDGGVLTESPDIEPLKTEGAGSYTWDKTLTDPITGAVVVNLVFTPAPVSSGSFSVTCGSMNSIQSSTWINGVQYFFTSYSAPSLTITNVGDETFYGHIKVTVEFDKNIDFAWSYDIGDRLTSPYSYQYTPSNFIKQSGKLTLSGKKAVYEFDTTFGSESEDTNPGWDGDIFKVGDSVNYNLGGLHFNFNNDTPTIVSCTVECS